MMVPCPCPYCPSPIDCAEWQETEEGRESAAWSERHYAAEIQGRAAAAGTWSRRSAGTGGFVTQRRSDNSTKGIKREN